MLTAASCGRIDKKGIQGTAKSVIVVPRKRLTRFGEGEGDGHANSDKVWAKRYEENAWQENPPPSPQYIVHTIILLFMLLSFQPSKLLLHTQPPAMLTAAAAHYRCIIVCLSNKAALVPPSSPSNTLRMYVCQSPAPESGPLK